MEKWEEALKEACLLVPIEVNQTEVFNRVREFLKLRQYETTCLVCGKTIIVNNKWDFKNAICPECKKIRDEKRKEREERAELERQKREKERQHRKLANFGTGKNTPACDFYLLFDLITEKDIEILTSMPYKNFLKTLYWRVVSRYVKWKNPTCSLCGSDQNLNVHHKTYENRGREYLTWKKDLIVLCDNCHKKFHDIFQEELNEK